MGIHKPKSVEVLLSDNDVLYWKIAEKTYSLDEIFSEVRRVEDLPFEIDDAARYVRIVLRGAGKCPDTHVRPGQDAKVYIDEIMVEVEKVQPKK